MSYAGLTHPVTRRIQVVDYDPNWPIVFSRLRDRIWPCLRDVAISIEHVGSTSVPGLCAKPVVDLDVVIRSRGDLGDAVSRLGTFGYAHAGNLGIEDRDAFSAPSGEPAHHLYVCPAGSVALRNHLTLRDHLRDHARETAAYAALKKRLAEEFPDNIDRYVEGKTEFILSILARHNLPGVDLDSIRRANQGFATNNRSSGTLQRIALPKNLDLIFAQPRILANKRQILRQRLGDENPVKRISMNLGQVPERYHVRHANGQDGDGISGDVPLPPRQRICQKRILFWRFQKQLP